MEGKETGAGRDQTEERKNKEKQSKGSICAFQSADRAAPKCVYY